MNPRGTIQPVLVSLKDVSVHFSQSRGRATPVRAVDNVSLIIPEKSSVGLVGESGSGKTTIARVILGLQKPTAGCVMPSAAVDEQGRALRRQVVFQNPYASLDPRLPIWRIVSEPLGRVSREEARVRVVESLGVVGLAGGRIDDRPSAFSGGERQRIAIARALIAKPDLIVLDEPTSALDATTKASIARLLGELRSDLDLTYFVISHDLGVVRYLSDTIAVMYAGRIVERGDTNSIYETPKHPYTRSLVESSRGGVPQWEEVSARRGKRTRLATGGCPFADRCPEALDRCADVAPPTYLLAPDHTVECHLYEREPE